jgi:tryptophanyl-tRNA synthetase
MVMNKEIILTGIRSNGELTLGNYLGAILPMVQLQKQKAGEYQLNFFVPDLHSFTTPVDHSTLFAHTIDNLRVFAAAGLDFGNADTFVYRQSYIPAHSELFTILNNFAYVGELSRMTQFKDKTKLNNVSKELKEIAAEFQELAVVPDEFGPDWSNHEDSLYELLDKVGKLRNQNISSGLFTYPVLMAADILLYGAKYVPVGDDQRQHLELTRDLAIRFNNKFGDVFTVPLEWSKQLAFYNRDNGVRIRSLKYPEKKMSKSVSDPAGTILLTDSPAEAAKKVMSATTDSFGEIQYDFKERPGISNLLQILALLSGRSQQEVNEEWAGKTAYGDLKKAVADKVEQFLTDFQAIHTTVDDAGIYRKLEESEARMRDITAEQLLAVQKAVGLR